MHTQNDRGRELLRRVEVMTLLDASDVELTRWTRDFEFPCPICIHGERHSLRYSVMLAVEQQLHELLGITPLESTPEIPSAEG